MLAALIDISEPGPDQLGDTKDERFSDGLVGKDGITSMITASGQSDSTGVNVEGDDSRINSATLSQSGESVSESTEDEMDEDEDAVLMRRPKGAVAGSL